jgi:hypothetical protein
LTPTKQPSKIEYIAKTLLINKEKLIMILYSVAFPSFTRSKYQETVQSELEVLFKDNNVSFNIDLDFSLGECGGWIVAGFRDTRDAKVAHRTIKNYFLNECFNFQLDEQDVKSITDYTI